MLLQKVLMILLIASIKNNINYTKH